eukprot:273556-Hanusia_phi.AAC.1
MRFRGGGGLRSEVLFSKYGVGSTSVGVMRGRNSRKGGGGPELSYGSTIGVNYTWGRGGTYPHEDHVIIYEIWGCLRGRCCKPPVQ